MGRRNRPRSSSPARGSQKSIQQGEIIPTPTASPSPIEQSVDESSITGDKRESRTARFSKGFGAFLLSAGFVSVVGLVIGAFQIAGVINMGIAHILIALAWVMAIFAVWLWLLSRPEKHRKKILIGTALVAGIILLGSDRLMVYLKTEQPVDLDKYRPEVVIDAIYQKYKNANKSEDVGVVIRTIDGDKEIIKKLVITFPVPGVVTKVYSGRLIKAEPCLVQVRPFITIDDEIWAQKVNLTCTDVLPGAWISYVAEFKRSVNSAKYDDAVSVEMYWTFAGKTQVTKMQVKPEYHDEGK